MNLGDKVLGQAVEFSVNTSHPETGNEADATGNPTYAVYEDGPDLPAIATGSMSKRDDAGTVGYYRGSITPQSVGGFEVGKSYEIRIRATVAGVTNSVSRWFNIVAVAAAAGSTPTAGLGPITAANVFTHLIGLESFLTAAAAKQGYTEAFVNARIIPAVLREFERLAQFRLAPIQVVSRPDGTYTTGKVVEEQPYHYFREKAGEFLATNLKYRPIQQVQRLRLILGNQVVLNVPAEWYTVDKRQGKFWILPMSGAMAFAGAQAAFALVGVNLAAKEYVPSVLHFDYIAGLPVGWESDSEWADLVLKLEEMVAYQVLKDISRTAGGGLRSKTVAADGLSQTFNYEFFEERKQELEASKKEFIDLFVSQESKGYLLSSV